MTQNINPAQELAIAQNAIAAEKAAQREREAREVRWSRMSSKSSEQVKVRR